MFANSRPSASNFKSFSQSVEQFFLKVGKNNFGKNIPIVIVAQSTGSQVDGDICKLQGRVAQKLNFLVSELILLFTVLGIYSFT